MNDDPLEGHPDSIEVRHVLDVVTRRPGCESTCPVHLLLAQVMFDYGRAVGLSEAEVNARYGQTPGNGPQRLARHAGGSRDTCETGCASPDPVSAESWAIARPDRPLPRETTATGSGS